MVIEPQHRERASSGRDEKIGLIGSRIVDKVFGILTLIVAVEDEDRETGIDTTATSPNLPSAPEDRARSRRFLLALYSLDTLGWLVAKLMYFELLTLAEQHNGIKGVLLISLILTTVEVIVEFAASALTPWVFFFFSSSSVLSSPARPCFLSSSTPNFRKTPSLSLLTSCKEPGLVAKLAVSGHRNSERPKPPTPKRLSARPLAFFALDCYVASAALGAALYACIGAHLVFGAWAAGDGDAGDSRRRVSAGGGGPPLSVSPSLCALVAAYAAQYAFLNQCGDTALELSKPHWHLTFKGATLRFPGCFCGRGRGGGGFESGGGRSGGRGEARRGASFWRSLTEGLATRREASPGNLAVFLALGRLLLGVLFALTFASLRGSQASRFGVAVGASLCSATCGWIIRRDATACRATEVARGAQGDGRGCGGWPRCIMNEKNVAVAVAVSEGGVEEPSTRAKAVSNRAPSEESKDEEVASSVEEEFEATRRVSSSASMAPPTPPTPPTRPPRAAAETSYPSYWRLPRLDRGLVAFFVCAFSLPDQAFTALSGLLALRLSPAAYLAVAGGAVVAVVAYFVRQLRITQPSPARSHAPFQQSTPSPRPAEYPRWLWLLGIAAAALSASGLLFAWFPSGGDSTWLFALVLPCLVIFAVAKQALQVRFTAFLFKFPEDRSSAVGYHANVLYVAAAGPLLALNWALVEASDKGGGGGVGGIFGGGSGDGGEEGVEGEEGSQEETAQSGPVAAVALAAGGAYLVSAIYFARCSPALRTGVDACDAAYVEKAMAAAEAAQRPAGGSGEVGTAGSLMGA